MAWTSPMTAVANAAFTAAQFNTYVRDNLSETAPSKATTAGRIFVSTGANAIAERAISSATVATSESTASGSFVALATPGPAVTVTTGTQALVCVTAQVFNNTSGGVSYMSYAVSGSTTVAASTSKALFAESSAVSDTYRMSYLHLETGLTAGSNTFTAQYAVTAGTCFYVNREILVIGL